MSAKSLRERAKDLSVGASISRMRTWGADNLTQLVLTIAVPQVPAVLAWFGHPSGLLTTACILGGLIASFILANQFAIGDALAQLMMEPDYEAWDERETLTIAQAGSLWAEVPVTFKGDSEQRYAKQTWLKEQVGLEQLTVLLNPKDLEGDAGMQSLVARSELTRLAESKKQRPKFLYKDQRVKRP